jgi:hypothetical protein
MQLLSLIIKRMCKYSKAAYVWLFVYTHTDLILCKLIYNYSGNVMRLGFLIPNRIYTEIKI